MSTSRDSQWPCIMAVWLLATALPSGATAQGWREDADATLRARCRLAVQTLEKGHPAPKSDWALSVIYRCNESGGAALAGLWSAAPSDSVPLEQLVEASSLLLDQRVYSGVLNSARNNAMPRAVRLAALRVLSSYISPSTVIMPDDLAKPRSDTAVVPSFTTQIDGPDPTLGTEPLPPSARTEIGGLFVSLWHSDADPIVRRAGRALSKRFF